jgi:hypothetical protein
MWNYRLCKQTTKTSNTGVIVSYGIHEVYYNEDGTIWGVTENPTTIGFDEFEIKDSGVVFEYASDTLKKIQLALTKPILDLDTIEYVEQHDSTNRSQ